MKTKINIQKIYDYLKNHQDLKDFEIEIDKYENIKIIDKRITELRDNDTFRDYSILFGEKNNYCLKFASTLGYRDAFDSKEANELHSKDIEFEIYKNMIYLYFDNQNKTNLNQIVEYIKFMADYLLYFD